MRYRVAPSALFALRAGRLVGPRRRGFRVLAFHDIRPERAQAFAALIDRAVAEVGVLAPADAEAVLLGGAPTPRPRRRGRLKVLFAFDDGFASALPAAQVLAARGLKGLFFVNPGLMALEGDAQREAVAANVFRGRVAAADLPVGMRLLRWHEAEAIAQLGHTIGGHGMTHRALAALPADEAAAEIEGSADALARRIGRPRWFAYPFGDVASISGPALALIARRFALCRSGVRGINRTATPSLAVRSDAVDLDAPEAWTRLVLEGGLDLLYWRARRRLDAMAAAAQP